MRRVFKYEISYIKKNWKTFLFAFALIALLFALFAFLPFLNGSERTFGYPQGFDRSYMLSEYADKLAEINEGLASGDPYYERMLQAKTFYEFFISRGTCEYDYILYSDIHLKMINLENVSVGFSLIEGLSFLSIAFGCIFGSYTIINKIENNSLKHLIQMGTSKNQIFNGKTIFWLIILETILLVPILISFGLCLKNINLCTLSYENEKIVLVGIWNLLLMKSISILVCGAFFYYISIFFGLFCKRTYLSILLPIIAYIIFFLLSNTQVPKWGDYGKFEGISKNLFMFLPLSNISMSSNYGIRIESMLICSIYLLLTIVLFVVSKKKFKKVNL